MKIKATLSISNPSGGGVSIRLRDEASRIEFFDGLISHEEFSRSLGHLSSRLFDSVEVRGMQYVGKTCITEPRTILCPLNTYDRKVLSAWLKENAQEDGWLLSTYLGSQSSITRQENGSLLKYSVTKYVDSHDTP